MLKSVGIFSTGLATVVPIAKCPVCAAAATGVFGTLGIATIGIEPWFVPVVAVLLLIGLWGFWQSARVHGKWPWFLLAVVGSALVLGGRLAGSQYFLWPGTLALFAAYVLDVVAKRRVRSRDARLGRGQKL